MSRSNNSLWLLCKSLWRFASICAAIAGPRWHRGDRDKQWGAGDAAQTSSWVVLCVFQPRQPEWSTRLPTATLMWPTWTNTALAHQQARLTGWVVHRPHIYLSIYLSVCPLSWGQHPFDCTFSLLQCQVPVYESFDYFEGVQTKPSGWSSGPWWNHPLTQVFSTGRPLYIFFLNIYL